MAKKPFSPIIGQISDAGEYGAEGEITNPGSLVYVTADGERLTPDEAFRRAGASGPGGRKGIAAATTAAAIALAFYYDEMGIDPHDPENDNHSELARRVAEYATERGLAGADLLEPAGHAMRDLMKAMMAELKRPQ
jgi:hypothetical protein